MQLCVCVCVCVCVRYYDDGAILEHTLLLRDWLTLINLVHAIMA